MEVKRVRRPCCEADKEVEPSLRRELRREREGVAQRLWSLPFSSRFAVFILDNESTSGRSDISPLSFTVISTLCSHLNKSRKLCLALGMMPLAIGSASLPVGSISIRLNGDRAKCSTDRDEVMKCGARAMKRLPLPYDYRVRHSLARHGRHSYAVHPSCLCCTSTDGTPWCCQTPPPSTWLTWGSVSHQDTVITK